MSLTVELRQADGTDNVTVTHVGQVVTLDVLGVVTGANGDPSQDSIDDVGGSLISAAVGTSAVTGNLAATVASAFAGEPGSSPGTVQDLNGDGNKDVGATSKTDSAGYLFVRTGGGSVAGTASNGSLVVQLGTVNYTVTSLSGGGETNVNFYPWQANDPLNPGIWTEDGQGVNQSTSAFQGGTPFHVFTAAQPASTTGSVTGTAYYDANGNGTEDGSETGLANGTLYVDVGNTGTYATGDPSALTDSTGTATIADVPTGSHKVGFLPPKGYSQSQPASDGEYTVTVTAGGTVAAGGPFGAERNGSLTGLVYDDANGNGTKDTGEAAVSQAVTVYLDENDNGVLDTGEPSTTTTSGSAGGYELTSVAPGTYIVRDVVPTGFTATEPSGAGSYTVTVGIAQAATVGNFGLQSTTGTVTGTVFNDVNGNGVQDAGDAGVAGVRVFDDAAGTGAYVSTDPSTTTASTGAYTLSGLAVGSDTILAVLPTGFARQSLPTGTAGYTVAVTANGTVAGKDFGVTNAAVAPTTGTVSGVVYQDTAKTGTFTAGDTLVSAETVYVDVGNTGVFVGTDPSAATDANGAYTISGVAPGTAVVRVQTTAEQTLSDPAAGFDSVTVTAGANTVAPDFGLTADSVIPTPPTDGTISGVVYQDQDASGTDTTGDTLLANETVYLDANQNGVDDAGELSAATDANGAYTIAGVPPGTYNLRLVTATGATLAQPTAGFYPETVTAGGAVTAQDFGLTKASPLPVGATTGTITGTVFADTNGNAAQDTGEAGLAGITVFLDAAGNGLLETGVTSAVTDATGAFTFTDVAPGTYSVAANVPDGDKLTTPTSTIASASDYTLIEGSTSVTVTAGVTSTVGPYGLEPVAAAATAAPLSVAIQPVKKPLTVVGGTKGTLRVKVTNTSAATFSGPLTFNVAASVDAAVSAADVSAGSFSVKKLTLKAGKSAFLTIRFTYPSAITTGAYYLTATIPFATTLAPATGATADATSAAPATTTIEFPDVILTPSFVAGATGIKVKEGKKASATVKVTNSGTVTATGPYTVNLYYTTATTLDGTATLLKTITTHQTSVRAGKAVTFHLPFTAPSLAQGSYTLYAVFGATTTPANSAAQATDQVSIVTTA